VTTSLSIPELIARLNEVDESHEIEAKRSASEVGKSALETISAFSNEPGLGGGYLLFGVTEDASRVFSAAGVRDPKKIEQEVSTLCAEAFNRTVRPRVWTETVEGAALVAAFVPEAAAPEKPVFIKSKGMQHGTFRRIGSTDQHCTEDDLRVLFQASTSIPHEDTLVAGATMEDLDPEVITAYRRSLIEANPATELRDASLDELVQSLGGAKRVEGTLLPTVAGVLLFGKRLSLRRLFPAVRVDYVRIPGTEWVPDPERRYESIEVREPLLVAFRRIYNAIVDDLPKSFTLAPGDPTRRDQLALPESAVREALVNALTHRDYRVASAVQVLRYQDRIEIRNAGYSLVEDDQLGEPGSYPRNPRIADVFREMRLAENKGTGVAAIRKLMQRAGLTPPVFDSDRGRNQFVVALWLHNLLGEDDTTWLHGFAALRLTDEQARALVVARRTGSVSNAMLRAVSGLDVLASSSQLRQLRDQGLLEPRGKGSATHYVLAGLARRPVAAVADRETGRVARERVGPGARAGEQTAGLAGPSDRPDLAPDRPDPPWDRPDLASDRPGLSSDRPDLSSDRPDLPEHLEPLPEELARLVEGLGQRPRQERLRAVIEALCGWRALSAEALGLYLGMNYENLSKRHLGAMVAEKRLNRTHPENPNHPAQAYRTAQGSLLPTNERTEDEQG
jgi:ATP-dependent DNA helicase RecG